MPGEPLSMMACPHAIISRRDFRLPGIAAER